MEALLKDLINKKIHLVGVTGAEGSSILKLLIKHRIKNIAVHDFIDEKNIEKSYKIWHKGLNSEQKNIDFKAFLQALAKTKVYFGKNYLENIETADLIFIPQSWRLYQANKKLQNIKKRIPFYSITRLYLDYTPCNIVAVTGTVGKGSLSYLLFQILSKTGKKVYFTGNETWMMQLADKLDELHADDILILELSHRQLQDGFNRAPHIGVLTNIYPNHLDEMSFQKYIQLKYSLFKKQKEDDYAVLNYDDDRIRRLASRLSSQILYFSSENRDMNTKNVQKYYSDIMNTKINHYPINILAAFTIADIFHLPLNQIKENINQLKSLPARTEFIGKFRGISFYDDIKSTTPWATIEAIKKLFPNLILICGGRIKDINYQIFLQKVKKKVKNIIVLKSQLSYKLKNISSYLITVDNLHQAISKAIDLAQRGDKILISPAAGFFYTDFIKNKTSIRKIISLLQEEQVLKD